MTKANLTAAIHQPMACLLQAHQVKLSQPRDCMLQLNAVPLGPGFNKRCTNALMRQRPRLQGWAAYVDDDLTYLGDVASRRAMFAGARRNGWLELTPAEPIAGDVNCGIVWLLEQLDSPLRKLAPRENGCPSQPGADDPPIDAESLGAPAFHRLGSGLMNSPVLNRVGRQLDLQKLLPKGFTATWMQSDAALLAAETVTRQAAPRCPLIIGPSGSGRSSIARMAADRLIRKGCVEQILEVTGAAIASGSIFWPERDERLRQTLAALEECDPQRRVLVLVEQFDLALIQSSVAAGLLADSLDAGLRMIAVARPGFGPKALRREAGLRRRLELVAVEAMPPDDALRIIRQCWSVHPLAERLEISADVPGLIVTLAQRRPGTLPGSALGMLDAVASRAMLVGQTQIGPDDLYHLVATA
ncbi:MAG: hypothetical protein AB7O62_09285 [Pirellulales bacterium]